MSTHGHAHSAGHDHGEMSELSETEVRVRALESLLVEKGYVRSDSLDRIVEAYETSIGPHLGARIVARAWTDPGFRRRLLADATSAIREPELGQAAACQLTAVANSADRHHVVVCTLCSCYPHEILGLPPTWYKSFAYRSRVVREPRRVLADFGLVLPETTEIRVWDSTANMRYLVVPERPAGTEDWPEERLAALVTRDSMVGTGLALTPERP